MFNIGGRASWQWKVELGWLWYPNTKLLTRHLTNHLPRKWKRLHNIAKTSFRHNVKSSKCPFVTMSYCHNVVSSQICLIILLNRHNIISSKCHFVTILSPQNYISSQCHFVTMLSRQNGTRLNIFLSKQYIVTMFSSHIAILPHYHTLTM